MLLGNVDRGARGSGLRLRAPTAYKGRDPGRSRGGKNSEAESILNRGKDNEVTLSQ